MCLVFQRKPYDLSKNLQILKIVLTKYSFYHTFLIKVQYYEAFHGIIQWKLQRTRTKHSKSLGEKIKLNIEKYLNFPWYRDSHFLIKSCKISIPGVARAGELTCLDGRRLPGRLACLYELLSFMRGPLFLA